MDQSWTSLLVKVTATVLVITAAALVAERSGPFWGGIVAGLPVVAGPFYVLLALQTDVAFIARSALSSFAAISAIGVFLLVLIRLAPRCRLAPALAMAVGAWLAAAAVLLRYPLSVGPAALVNVLVVAVCVRLTRDAWWARTAMTAMPRRWFDVPVRALIIGGFVVGVTAASRAIGQAGAGISTMFPLKFGEPFHSSAWPPRRCGRSSRHGERLTRDGRARCGALGAASHGGVVGRCAGAARGPSGVTDLVLGVDRLGRSTTGHVRHDGRRRASDRIGDRSS